MAFILIKGNFKPLAGLPDGDSVRFKADNLSLFNNLEGRRVEIGTGVETLNTVQLRFEGIDAIEKAATKPLSVQAKENMLFASPKSKEKCLWKFRWQSIVFKTFSRFRQYN